MSSALTLLFYISIATGVYAVASFLRRPIEIKTFALFVALPVLFLFPSFLSNRTALPVDHSTMHPPWNSSPNLPHSSMRNENLNDIAFQFAPWTEAVRKAWREGEIPLRNRWNGCGTPLAANGQCAAFSPLVLMTLALPIEKVFALRIALTLFLALAGMWLWLRELGISEAPSLFGSVAFSFSFVITPWLFFPHALPAALCPWLLFLVEVLQDPRAKAGRVLAVLLGLFTVWPLLGHLETVLLWCAFTALWLVVRRVAGTFPHLWRNLKTIGMAAIPAVGLTAFFLLPHWLAIQASNRIRWAQRPHWWRHFSWTPHGPLTTDPFFTAFFPRVLGDAMASPMVAPSASFYENGLPYFGMVGWAAAILVLRPGSKRSRIELTLLAPLLCGSAIALGIWPFAELAGHIPVLNLMLPFRFLSWVSMAGAAIAAFELDRLQKDLASSRTILWYPVVIASVLGAFAVASFSRFVDLHRATGGLPSQLEALKLTLAVLGVTIAAVGFWSLPRLRLPAAGLTCCLAALLGMELFIQGGRLYRWSSPRDFFPEMPILEFLRQQKPPFRVLGEGPTLFPNSNVFAGLEEVRVHDPVERSDYVDFLDATCGYDPRPYFKFIMNPKARVLDFLNVKYLLSALDRKRPSAKWSLVYAGSDGKVFENKQVLPRVFAPERISVVRKRFDGSFPESAVQAYGSAWLLATEPRDWARDAVALDEGRSGFHPAATGDNARLTVSGWHESTNAANFHASVSSDRPVVAVASLVQDGGWSAQDHTGRTIPAGRANGPFLAVLLPPGERTVLLDYSPPGFRLGSLVSLATLLALIGAIAFRHRANRHAR